MSAFFPPLPPNHAPGGPAPTTRVDPSVEREVLARRWEVRSAQWRAWTLAEAVFGPGVRVTLSPYPGRGAFRALFYMEVPFENLESHRRLEAIFASCSAADPVLGRIPCIFALEPAFERVPEPVTAVAAPALLCGH